MDPRKPVARYGQNRDLPRRRKFSSEMVSAGASARDTSSNKTVAATEAGRAIRSC
jgi:hypothetical protein